MPEEKHLAPTQARLERARREGDVPRSSDITTAGSLAGGILGLLLVMPLLANAAQRCAFVSLREERVPFGAYAFLAIAGLVPMLGGALGAGAATFAQTRRIALRFPKFAFEKLDPIKGLQRMFSRDALVAAAKSCCMALVTGLALYPSVRGFLAGEGTLEKLEPLVVGAMETILVTVTISCAAFGVVDLAWENAKWRRRLRMSFDEVKRDLKQSEGDPHVRNRRKQTHRGLLRGSITRLREAAFVVTNPTHVAVALEYRPPEVEVPRVLIRAIDAGAMLVKERARELGIPLVEDVALARALLASTQVGGSIPRGAYEVVARIVASLIRHGLLKAAT